MTDTHLQTALLEEVKEAFNNVRGSTLVAMKKLHQVKESGIWQTVADNFGQYVEQELGISQSFASKLLTVNQHYLLAGVSQDKIEGVDYEVLYLSTKLKGTLEENLEKARTLSRREIKEELYEDKPHEHEPITICKKCSMRI